MVFCEKARIPTQRTGHVAEKVKKLFQEWTGLKKNKANRRKEVKHKLKIVLIVNFIIFLALRKKNATKIIPIDNATKIIPIEEDCQFCKPKENQEDKEEWEPLINSYMKKKTEKLEEV